ncbi:MAG: N-6 DNA methylase [Syntrophales bacterium]|nr:N-6 DNA methylase [Syntrophales bacterium]
MSAPEEIHELVERFDRNIDTYRSGRYNEAQVRQEFINPFFNALGWDVYNKQGYAEAYKDVIHEDAIKIGSATKAPDYCFRIGGTRKFFLEAKKPSVDIKQETPPAYQLRRYAWSAKLPLSILTDFEELAVYDCRIKPVKTDKPSRARTLYFTYNEYIERWDEIASIFSRESVLKGSFDKYVESSRVKRGTAEVDTAFLEEIERWREVLARNIALRNPGLTRRELNFAVQRTIDRVIFLRICEDRGIEPYGQLMALRNGSHIYGRLCQMFQQADDRYNSGLFHFKKEKDRVSPPDDLTLDIAIDDKPLKDIFTNLYYPDSPYEFSVLPADILGQVYERFLGKVIRLTPGHRAIVEEKPEVKKAGGVYYTPTYIVDYIVKQTVGKLVEGKKTGSRGAVSKLKILDPACGSGSFLIGAYQYLLDWHRDQYIADDPEKWAKGRNPALYQAPGGEWKLTTAEKKRILLNNIYGVDIDTQAVEVTKLSLLLKVLEDENAETIGKQLALFQERALPDLGSNIKCGNSLIGPDFYEEQQLSLLDEEEMYRVNVFDWETEFPEIMQDGGFDAVIGNPPYGALFLNEEIEYLLKNYTSFEYQLNSFVIFMERGSSVLKRNGKISYITPAVFLAQHYFKNIRKVILENYSIENILILNYKVFKDADIGDTCIFVFNNNQSKNNIIRYAILREESEFDDIFLNERGQNDFSTNPRYEIYLSVNKNLFSKIENISISLGELANCIMGIKPYQKGKGKPKQIEQTVKNRVYDSNTKQGELYKNYLIGKDIDRYVIYPLEQRYIKYGEWLAEPRFTAPFEKSKIILRQTSDRIRAVIDQEKHYNLNNIYNVELKNTSYHYNYILGIINSKLMVYIYQKIVPEKGKLFAEIKKVNLVKLPIRTINFSDPTDIARHDRMVDLVEQMLDLKKQLAEAKVPQTKTVLQRQIENTDRQIDKLVYELYELTEDEIRIVEAS